MSSSKPTASSPPIPAPITPHRSRHHALGHLVAASHLLAASSPPIAAHLMSRFYSLLFKKGINLPKNTAAGACPRCGGMWVLGWNCFVGGEGDGGRGGRVVKRERANRRRKRGKDSGGGVMGGRVEKENGRRGEGRVEWVCDRCGVGVGKGSVGSGGGRRKGRGKGKEDGESGLLLALAQTVGEKENAAGCKDSGSKEQCTEAARKTEDSTAKPAPGPPSASEPPRAELEVSKPQKRKKANKNSSLQAMIAAKRERERATVSGAGDALAGMDLMDLMKLGVVK